MLNATIEPDVVTLGEPSARTYRVSGVVVNAGTAEATAAGLANMGLYHGLALVTGPPTISAPVRQEFERVTLIGAECISVKSIAAAIAGLMYVASLPAVRLGG